jgi:hypothetical protein
MLSAHVKHIELLQQRITWLERRLEQREGVISVLADQIAAMKTNPTPGGPDAHQQPDFAGRDRGA